MLSFIVCIKRILHGLEAEDLNYSKVQKYRKTKFTILYGNSEIQLTSNYNEEMRRERNLLTLTFRINNCKRFCHEADLDFPVPFSCQMKTWPEPEATASQRWTTRLRLKLSQQLIASFSSSDAHRRIRKISV